MKRSRIAPPVSVIGLLFVVASGAAACGLLSEDGGGSSDPGVKPGLSNARIVENPNNALSAIVDLKTERPATVELKIRRDGSTVQTLGPTAEQKRHSFDVLGLHAETTYQFEFVATSTDGRKQTSAQKFTSGPLPDSFPPLKVKTSKPEKAADGIRLMSLYRWRKASNGRGYQTGWGMIVGVDQHGEVVWYYRADHWTWNAHRLSNGNLMYIIADDTAVEIDMMGNVLHKWHAGEDLDRNPSDDEFGLHHSVVEQEDGNFVTLSTELQRVKNYKTNGNDANVVGDVALEFNREGEVLNSWSMFEILSDYKTRRRYGSGGPKWNDEYGKSTKDWSHANALNLGDTPGTLIASLRHQNWVVKWDRQTGQLLWRLGPDGDFEFPKGSDGRFNYHQHAPNWLENGNLMVYDNGNFRRSVDPGERFYTRAVEFELDASNVDIEKGKKGTVEQVWQLKHPPKYFAPHVGDAELLPNETVMIADGGLLENPKACTSFDKNGDPVNRTWNCIADPKNLNWARLLEVTHDQKKEKVLEIWIKDTSSDEPRGYTMYRADFLQSLYPDREGGSEESN